MDSPHKRNKYCKRNNKSNTTITETNTTNGNSKNNKITKTNEKNDLKGGAIPENNHEDNTKFISLSRKMIDNN